MSHHRHCIKIRVSAFLPSPQLQPPLAQAHTRGGSKIFYQLNRSLTHPWKIIIWTVVELQYQREQKEQGFLETELYLWNLSEVWKCNYFVLYNSHCRPLCDWSANQHKPASIAKSMAEQDTRKYVTEKQHQQQICKKCIYYNNVSF